MLPEVSARSSLGHVSQVDSSKRSIERGGWLSYPVRSMTSKSSESRGLSVEPPSPFPVALDAGVVFCDLEYGLALVGLPGGRFLVGRLMGVVGGPGRP